MHQKQKQTNKNKVVNILLWFSNWQEMQYFPQVGITHEYYFIKLYFREIRFWNRGLIFKYHVMERIVKKIMYAQMY